MNAALSAAKDAKVPVYTFGPLVHNDQVIRELSEKGIVVVDSEEMLSKIPAGIMIIRAHGITRELETRLKDSGFTVIDATCPFVKKIHRIVDEASRDGLPVLIVGDGTHPEVKGICGWVNGPVSVIKEPEEVEKLTFSKSEPLKIVVQTTFQPKKLKILLEKLKNVGYNAFNIADTVCNATRERQLEAERLSETSDVMIVIGGEHSSNSQKLYEICKNNCDHTYFIQTSGDLRPEWFQEAKTVGITAGASTPKKIIMEVQTKCRNLNKC